MADGTEISWADATWNPITGCAIKSPACTHCYAMKLAGTRLRNHHSRVGLTTMTKAGPVWTGEVRLNINWLDQPLQWKKPRDVFVVAHGDLFYERVPSAWIVSVFERMEAARQHRYLVLTKRPDRALQWLTDNGIWTFNPMPHVWIGGSVERQQEADERRDSLREIADRGWNTWVSYEPALGLVDWSDWGFIRWLVSGGESDTDGKSARPSHPDWHRAARDFCKAYGVPYHFKQRGSWTWDDFDPASDSEDGALDVPMDWRSMPGRFRCLRSDGNRVDGYGGGDETFVARVGKKAAGALLDGREWRQMPARGT